MPDYTQPTYGKPLILTASAVPITLEYDTPADSTSGIGTSQSVSTDGDLAPGREVYQGPGNGYGYQVLPEIMVDNEIIYVGYRIGGASDDPVPAARAQEGTPLEAHQAGTLCYPITSAAAVFQTRVLTVAQPEGSSDNNYAVDDYVIDITTPTNPVTSFYTPPVAELPRNAITNVTWNFVNGSTPAEVETLASLGILDPGISIAYQPWHDYRQGWVTKLKPYPRFSAVKNFTTGFIDLTIEAGVHSEYGNLTPLIPPMGSVASEDAATEKHYSDLLAGTSYTYVPGSYDYGWGRDVIPPYGAWWIYPAGSNGGQSSHSAGETFVTSYLFGAPVVSGTGWLNRGGPTLETEIIDSVYGQLPVLPFATDFVGETPNPFSANSKILHASVTTTRLRYSPGTSQTTGSRVGMALMEISSRRIIGFGQTLGSTTLNIWTWTTVNDDSLNHFEPVFTNECYLPLDDIFLRIYVGKNGDCRFLYSADNVAYYEAFELGTTTPYFTYGPSRVGVFMFHLRSYPTYEDLLNFTNYSPQCGSLNCCHWEQFIDYNDVGIDPTTYRTTLVGRVYS